MLDLSLFRNRTFSGANTVMLLSALAMFGVFFYVSLYMQHVLGYSPTQAGASFLPMTVLIILVAPQAGRLSDRFGSRSLVGGGLTLLSILLLLLLAARSGRDASGRSCPAMIIGGIGMALDDDADDRGRDGLGAARQGGRRLGRPEQRCARSAARSGSRSWARSSPRG